MDNEILNYGLIHQDLRLSYDLIGKQRQFYSELKH